MSIILGQWVLALLAGVVAGTVLVLAVQRERRLARN